MTVNLLSELVGIASVTPDMYALKNIEIRENKIPIGEPEKLYLIAQCTRDLSSMDCQKCLNNTLLELQSCCAWQQSGLVYSETCLMAYSTNGV